VGSKRDMQFTLSHGLDKYDCRLRTGLL
jgi:hypothetical protein